jgi:predicted Ser/Thr protein kinase
VDELFAAALELEGEALQQFLDERCAGDAELRREADAMLGYARASESFLEKPPLAEATVVWSERTDSRGPIDQARFIPGDIVANRYRIAGLLGRGGMGEVYRADDLKLSQPVALKFLAESLASSGAALARFHREVSVARQISHRHVCRVYDIGEHAGMHFLSMEYVRGEELSSLLKRIGRLPLDKAVETARQLCAGLAAIHHAGVLHRDLKPANVMIDEHGDVRITDFGIAALSTGVAGREAMIGTPAYMSPEQLSGGELTTSSDIYALGLVLYETFTGKRPFAATTLPDVVRDRLGDTAPTNPSDWVADLDPLVERVILRCLEKDPDRRPASALQIAAALPGGDPLAAALAAGETPSPQMVAASSRAGGLRPLMGMLLLAWIAIGAVVFAVWSSRTTLHRVLPLDSSPEVLRARAGEIARDAGYGDPPADVVSGFEDMPEVTRYITADPRTDRWERLRARPLPVLQFWYRQSSIPLDPPGNWNVHMADPPHDVPGMISMRLDHAGRLLFFRAVPPQEDSAAARAQTPDWNRFFERAGLSISAFRPATPVWTPPHHSDARFSWTGTHPLRPDVPLRIEAASYRGAPTYFEVVWPWQHGKSARLPGVGTQEPFAIVLLVLYFGTIALASLLAWRNLRLGRGDRRGTFRLMLFVFASRIVYWLFLAHHIPTVGEVGLLIAGLKSAVYWAALLGLLYLALEPFVRRRWPETLISWSRLLNGDIRDPLVGRDFLIGGAGGIAAALGVHLYMLVPALTGRPVPAPPGSPLMYIRGLDGVRGFMLLLLDQVAASILFPLIVNAVLLFFAMVTRRNRIAIAITWLIFYGALNVNFADGTAIGYVIGVIFPTILMIVLTRLGLFAAMAFFFFTHLWAFYPATPELSAWYATSYLLQLAVIAALSLFAFKTALAGQKVFNDRFLDG